MSQQQIIQLIIIALVAGSSGLGWVLRKLKEHADKRAREQSMERRKLESLRTGREAYEDSLPKGSVGAPVPAQASQQSQQASEIADRRKRQLEELRKRQLARTQRSDEGGGGSVFAPEVPSGGRPTPRAMPRSIPGTSGTTVPIPQDRGGRQAGKQAGPSGGRQQRQRDRGGQRGPAPVVQQQQQQRMDAPQRSDVPGRAAALKSGEEGSPSIGTGTSSASASIASVMAELDARRGQKQAMLGGKPITREDWRRAIVMNEILSTPVSLREPE